MSPVFLTVFSCKVLKFFMKYLKYKNLKYQISKFLSHARSLKVRHPFDFDGKSQKWTTTCREKSESKVYLLMTRNKKKISIIFDFTFINGDLKTNPRSLLSVWTSCVPKWCYFSTILGSKIVTQPLSSSQINKHRKIAKGCLENISSVVKV